MRFRAFIARLQFLLRSPIYLLDIVATPANLHRIPEIRFTMFLRSKKVSNSNIKFLLFKHKFSLEVVYIRKKKVAPISNRA